MSDPTRRLELIDLDNLICGPRHSERVTECLERYDDKVGTCRQRHQVIAGEHTLLREVAFDLPRQARILVGRGPDGADLRLHNEYPVEFVARRYSNVIIASGDGVFADYASALGRAGVHVVVAALPRSLSRRLRMAASDCVALEAFWDAATLVGA